MRRPLLCTLACLAALVPHAAMAQAARVWVYCGNLPGCGAGTASEFASSVFQLLINALPQYIYVVATLFVMIGGARMVLSAGREDWVTKGKDTITWALVAVAVTIFSVQIVSMVESVALNRVPGGDFALSAANTVASLIFDLLYLALLCVAIYSGMLMVLSAGQDDSFSKGKNGLLWAAIGAIVINLAQVIVNAFETL